MACSCYACMPSAPVTQSPFAGTTSGYCRQCDESWYGGHSHSRIPCGCGRAYINWANNRLCELCEDERAKALLPLAIKYGPDTPPVVTRDRVKPLELALKAISADRNATHGEPEDSFGAIAAFWKVYDQFNKGQNGEAHDVAMRQLLLKVARICVGSSANLDSYTDAAGYAGCAYELAVQHSKRMKES